jgi:MoaA/NifB/PqqE/SkfB family radical SAM enzyme
MTDLKPCILPWINFSTNPTGRPRVCGYSDMKTVKSVNTSLKVSTIEAEWNNDYFKKIRADFINGKWPENCKRCEYVEKLGGHSKRLDENIAYYEKYKHLIEQTSADGSVSVLPRHIDVRTGTTCNQKCIHCGTSVSSKWREDKSLFDKYPNTETSNINDRWIDVDTRFWDYLRDNMQYFKRYNFLGGESFANKRHNEYLRDLSNTEYAKDIELQYVTNGVLITKDRLEQLSKFKNVNLRLSVDAHGAAGEYFRFPMNWNEFMEKSKLVHDFIADKKNFNVGFQWTCSNISIFYLDETYRILTDNFPNIRFIFSNHVEFPAHMSAQNLPVELKEEVLDRLSKVRWVPRNRGDVEFYINHMLEKDTWDENGSIFFNYLDDLDNARSCSWKHSFEDMELNRFHPANKKRKQILSRFKL